MEYDFFGKIPVVILYRKKGSELTNKCPFCGTGHIHGSAQGHRIAHCGSAYANASIFASDGTQLFMKHGYIIRDI